MNTDFKPAWLTENLLYHAERCIYEDGSGIPKFHRGEFMRITGVTQHKADFVSKILRSKVVDERTEYLAEYSNTHTEEETQERQVKVAKEPLITDKTPTLQTTELHLPPEFQNLKEGEFNYTAWMDFAKKGRQLRKEADTTQRHASIEIAENKPIAIAFSADWHLGSVSVDYDSWEKNMRTLIETPGLYLAVLGDLVDNFAKFKDASAVLSQVIPPKYQRRMLRDFIHELIERGKLLYSSWGNHDWEWNEKWIGDDLMADIFERVPTFADTGIAKIRVGDCTYTHLVSHLPKFNSRINKLHGNKQMYRFEFPADIVVTGHTHDPDFETFTQYQDARELGYDIGGTSVMVKVGTFKVDDKYSKRYFGRPAIAVPTVVHYPNERRIVPFLNAEDAVIYMNSLR